MQNNRALYEPDNLDSVARRLDTLAIFPAIDPWNADRQTEFRIEECVMATARTKVRPGEKKPWAVHLIALWSRDASQEHFVPESLAQLWRSGRVPAGHLPRLVHAAEKALVESDYYLMARRMKWVTWTFHITAMIVFAMVFGLEQLAIVHGEGPSEPAALAMAVAIALLYWGLGTIGPRLRRLRCDQQMRWALAQESAIVAAEESGGSLYEPRADGLQSGRRFYTGQVLINLAYALALLAFAGASIFPFWK